MSKIFVDTIEPKTTNGNLTINNTVLFPNRPAFRVLGPNSTQSGQNITAGYLNITWWEHTTSQAFINNTNDFNTSVGIYTAPVTGVYHYDISVSVNNVASGYYSIWMQINGAHTTTQPYSITDPTNGSAKDTITNSGLLSLTAGDEVKWTHKADPDTSVDFEANRSAWSMYLVG